MTKEEYLKLLDELNNYSEEGYYNYNYNCSVCNKLKSYKGTNPKKIFCSVCEEENEKNLKWLREFFYDTN